MVTPPALSAAIPVGATMAKFLCVDSLILRNKVVLPVPALPVKKIVCWVWLMNCSVKSAAERSCWLKVDEICEIKRRYLISKRKTR